MKINTHLYNKEYFENLSHSGKLIQRDNRVFFSKWLSRFLRKVKPKGIVLDIGCGDGFYIDVLEKDFFCLGAEISLEGLKRARARGLVSQLIICDAHYIPIRQDYLGFIIALDLIEHLPNPQFFFNEAHRVLKKDGFLLISTPNPCSLGKRLKKKRWFAYNDSTHISLKTPEEWREIFMDDFHIARDGTDWLWDLPYPLLVPTIIQKICFVPINCLIKFFFGFFPWSIGENYLAILRK